MFDELNFHNLNETDIREEVITPLVRALGYRSGTKNNIIREQSLRYPRIFLGRKKKNKDPVLRGIADYILEVDNSVRWVIEAKAPDVEIDLDSIEQAYTYANHPEVRAVYFVLSNGKHLNVYHTHSAPGSDPLLSITYEEFNDKFQIISNVLSPESIKRDFPKVECDLGNLRLSPR